MDNANITALSIIFCVAIGTYALRVSGLLFSNKLIRNKSTKLFLDYLPATMLLSLVIPSILKEGALGLVATLLIALSMYKTRSILLSMIIGVAIIALSRNFLL